MRDPVSGSRTGQQSAGDPPAGNAPTGDAVGPDAPARGQATAKEPAGDLPAGDPPAGVDLILPVQEGDPSISALVRSVLDYNAEGTLLTVVCHNRPVAQVKAELDAEHRSQVSFLEHEDDRHGRGSPVNAGIEETTGEYLCLLRPQDYLMPRSLISWFWTARNTGADAVLAPVVRGPERIPVPLTARRMHRGFLDPVRDRLCYRDRVSGLISREALTRLGLRLDESVRLGSEVGLATRLWFEGRVVLDRRGPVYVRGSQRADVGELPIRAHLKFLRRILKAQWFDDLSVTEQRSACVAFTRTHLFPVVSGQGQVASWDETDRKELAKIANRLMDTAPGMEAVLSRAELALLEAIRRVAAVEILLAQAAQVRAGGSVSNVVPDDLTRFAARDAPWRSAALASPGRPSKKPGTPKG